ncbi:MAG: NeuD/PglB/VioB family sugar acetyltransferase [Amoebophilaceae bacterium]|jgi:sugar O-acyltransferase (sialic acid O-acetyltransferase NeuD family)|nr:NeuD/PglB/VioB family sugar acetyltransferase [Amoebophilaceae bacterium]
MGDPVIIFGAYGLGKVVLEIFQKNNIVVYGFLDDDHALQGQIIDGVPVLGNTAEEQYLDLIGEQCDVFVAVEQQAKRQRLVTMLHKRNKTVPVNAIHPSAIIATSAVLGYGNLINTGVSLGAGASLDSHCTLHTRVTVEHDAVIKEFVQIGAGSTIGAGAQLDNSVFVGAGATIVAGVIVGKAASIGAGAVVLTNVEAGTTVLGNPAVPTERK